MQYGSGTATGCILQRSPTFPQPSSASLKRCSFDHRANASVQLADHFLEACHGKAEAPNTHAVMHLPRPGRGQQLVEIEMVRRSIANAKLVSVQVDLNRTGGAITLRDQAVGTISEESIPNSQPTPKPWTLTVPCR